MNHAVIAEIETQGSGGNTSRRVLSETLELADVALNHYELTPGERFSSGLHAHLDQEELFYVLTGTATFDYRPAADAATQTLEVESGEVLRFAPGEYQTGGNDGDEPVEALGIGAPKGSGEVRVPGPCSECGEPVLELDFGSGQNHSVCPACGDRIPVNV